MQRLEVSGAVRLIYRSLGIKGLKGLSLGECVIESEILWDESSWAVPS